MTKKEKIIESKKFMNMIEELGYENIGEFIEMVCAFTALVTNKDKLAKDMIEKMIGPLQSQCGYIMSKLNFISKLKHKQSKLNKEDKEDKEINKSIILDNFIKTKITSK